MAVFFSAHTWSKHHHTNGLLSDSSKMRWFLPSGQYCGPSPMQEYRLNWTLNDHSNSIGKGKRDQIILAWQITPVAAGTIREVIPT